MHHHSFPLDFFRAMFAHRWLSVSLISGVYWGGEFDDGQNLDNWLTANLIGLGIGHVYGHSGQEGGL